MYTLMWNVDRIIRQSYIFPDLFVNTRNNSAYNQNSAKTIWGMDTLYQTMVQTMNEGDPSFDADKEIQKKRKEKDAEDRAREHERKAIKLKGSSRG